MYRNWARVNLTDLEKQPQTAFSEIFVKNYKILQRKRFPHIPLIHMGNFPIYLDEFVTYTQL